MTRAELLEIVRDLYGVLEEKKISPSEAESVADIFQRSIKENNEIAIKEYAQTRVFRGNPPAS